MTPAKIILILALIGSAISAVSANAPGGTYIQCDPHNANSPVRCVPDSW
jgi:hypothetical protein